MPNNYRFTIEYDGARYRGWQKLGDTGATIQGKLEQVLSRMADAPVEVIGAGRTDAGVHARGQTANAVIKTEKTEMEILGYVNQYLPDDIRILSVETAPLRFHSRFHAKEKQYCYYVSTAKKTSVFQRKYMYQLGERLDTKAMRSAAELLLGTHDFKSFCGNKHIKKSTVRTINRIDIFENEEREEIQFCFCGDGFLQYMIRILTGTLIEVGQHKRDAETMTALLEAKNRELAGFTAPPQGLFLEKIWY